MNEHTNIPLYAQHKRVGAVVNGVLHKDRTHGSKDFLRKPPAIALQVESLEAALDAGATSIQITDVESNLVYSVSIQDFLHGCQELNRGYGDQVFLPLPAWHIHKGGARQLAFWGEGGIGAL